MSDQRAACVPMGGEELMTAFRCRLSAIRTARWRRAMTDTPSESEGAGDGGATKSVAAMQTSDAARSCRCQAECLSVLTVCVSRRRALCAFLCTRRLLKSVRRYAHFSKADGQTGGDEQIELLDGQGVR